MNVSSKRIVPMCFIVLILLLITIYYREDDLKYNNYKKIKTNEYDGHTLNHRKMSERHKEDFDMTTTISTIPGSRDIIDTSAKNGSEQPPALRRRDIEAVLWDSIESYHLQNFVKPKNESCERRVPVCIIIGVGKCGTRELTDFLRLHPHIEIYRANIYEMPYFKGQFHRGVEWLKSKMPCTYSNQITIMKHAAYFHSMEVPERLRKFNESIKLILLVREPVSRTISKYMFSKKGSFDAAKFTHFLIKPDKSINAKNTYVSRSKYDSAMELWLKYFNLSQFLIIESDELKTYPSKVLKKTEKFLGLENFITPDMFVLNKQNGFYCIRSNLTDNGMACYGSNRGRKQPVFPQDTLSTLKKYFKPSNERFFNIIGKQYYW